MSDQGARSRPRPPASAERLVAVARELTQEKGLRGWTLRELEQRAEVSPSSIYHHLGNRQAICERVVETITDEIDVDHDIENWQDFLRHCCSGLFETLTRYPGSAAWLMAHGPVQPTSIAIMETGTVRLEAAGIHPSGLAYSLVINHALGVIASAEDRRTSGGGDHGQIVRRMREAGAGDSPAVAAMGVFLGSFVVDHPRELGAVRRDYFDAAVDTTLAGVEHGYRAGAVRGVQRFAARADRP